MAGGGWTRDKGTGYLKLSQNAIYSGNYYSPDGTLIDITTIGLYTTSLYGEYGITEKLTAIAYVPFFTRSTLNKTRFRVSGEETPGDELNAFGDVDVSLQYRLYKSDKWVVSGRLLFGIPSGTVGGGESGILQTGDGEFNQMLRVDASRAFAGSAWFSAYTAFNNRTEDFSEEYRFGLEVGYKAWNKVLAVAKVDVVQSFFNGTDMIATGNTIFGNNVEYVSPSIELAYVCKSGLGVSIATAGAFAGKNILASPNYGVGVFYSF